MDTQDPRRDYESGCTKNIFDVLNKDTITNFQENLNGKSTISKKWSAIVPSPYLLEDLQKNKKHMTFFLS